jgi:hypothetical protein
MTQYEIGDLVFSTRPDYTNVASTERMRINSGGNVGIGTASIGATLDISGSTAFDGTTSLRLINNASQYGRTQLTLIGRWEGGNDAWTLNGGRNQIIFGYQTSLGSGITYPNSIQSYGGNLGFFASGYSTANPAQILYNNGSTAFNAQVVANAGGFYAKEGSGGYASLKGGGAGNYCGYIEFYNSTGTRRGYLGYGDTSAQQYLVLACESGCLGWWITNGNLSVDGTLQANFSSISATNTDHLGVYYNYPSIGSSSKQTIYSIFGTFTGFHRCFTDDELFSDDTEETIQKFKNNYVGRVVVSTGKIATDTTNENQNWEIKYDKEGITIEDALPMVQLSRKRKDKRVFGVLGSSSRKNS